MKSSLFLSTGSLWLLLIIDATSHLHVQGAPEDHCITLDEKHKKIVCVCNEDHCDDFDYKWPVKLGEAHLISSTRDGQRFRVSKLAPPQPYHWKPSVKRDNIYVNIWYKMQTILGWGGAFTDASAINIQSVAPNLGDQIINSYYGQNGLEYNFGRVPISGADFSTRTYTYDDTDKPDYNLTRWSLQEEDFKLKIPTIRRAMKLTQDRNVSLNLFGSSWSPPVWMKANHQFPRGHLIDQDEIYSSYANYLVKFYDAYKAQGIPFWGGTVQNEPVTANDPNYWINSLQMTNEEAIRLVAHHLGPALEAAGYTKDKFKLMVGDDNLDAIKKQVPEVMSHNGVKKYVSGLAFHWYNSGRHNVSYDILLEVFEPIKNYIDFILMTEACNGFDLKPPLVDLGSWERGEKYAKDIIEDLLRLTNGWIDWNLCLDTEGGPNWAKNFVDAAIIVNKNKNEFYKQPMFYALGHFSKFLKPESVRVFSWLNETGDEKKILSVAVLKEDTGHLVVVVQNRYDEAKKISIHYVAKLADPEYLEVDLEARSINTIVLKIW